MATPVEIIQAFDASIVEVCGANLARPWPHPRDKGWAHEWIAAGATADICKPVFKTDMERRKEQKRSRPLCLAYYNNPVMDAIAVKEQEDKEANALHPEDLRWKVRVQSWQRNPGFWHEALWAPPPCLLGCRVPRRVLEMVGAR